LSSQDLNSLFTCMPGQAAGVSVFLGGRFTATQSTDYSLKNRNLERFGTLFLKNFAILSAFDVPD
ncbi:MAG TPA: hypothetical protein VHA52_01005, partial [Candidatus Babeliaceae bacterium]|nr:hypothetical protein [Candidatus Babeliaceae bacterium]